MNWKKILQRYIEWLGWGLFSPLRWTVEWFLQRRRLVVLYRVWGIGRGDALVISTVLSALHDKYGVRGIVFSKFPELFEHNPQVVANLDYNRMRKLTRSLLKSLCKYLRGKSVLCVGGETWTLGTFPWQEQPTERRNPYYVQGMQKDFAGRVDTTDATPLIAFGSDELQAYSQRFAWLPGDYGVVKASVGVGRAGFMQLKNWRVDGMQQVIRQFPDLPWVQIGESNEEVLNGAINLVGQTSLRETFWLLSGARVVLTVEGLISHAAAAFARPTVVVFSGWHEAAGLCYPTTIAVSATPPPPCAPCWQDQCATPGKPCTNDITVQQVVDAVRAAVQRPAGSGRPVLRAVEAAAR
jgi:hypothetical protein